MTGTTMDTGDRPPPPGLAAPSILARPGRRGFWPEGRLYLAGAALTMIAVTVMTRLWQASMSIPFWYESDAISSASHFKTTLQLGWYEYQPDLGFPYGQHYHDYPFSDDLHPAVIKALGLVFRSWPVVFNVYYLLGFPLAALAAVWFLRRCGLSGWFSVVLAVLFAVAPYHFQRGQIHFFLGEYYAVPLALGVVLAVIRGEAIWGRRTITGRWARNRTAALALSVITGPGAGTAAALMLITLDSAYYAVFTGALLGAAALLALIRTARWRRFGGAVVAAAVLGVAFIAASLPDTLYGEVNGKDPGAVFRNPYEAELYALKFVELILPAAGHPIPAWAALRQTYDTSYPFPGEDPALGTIGALGFLLLLGVAGLVLLGRWSRGSDPVGIRRARTLYYLSSLTVVAFLAGTVGGLGTLIALGTPSIRGWNRISIFSMLLVLAGFGLAVEAGLQRLAVRSGRRPASIDRAGTIRHPPGRSADSSRSIGRVRPGLMPLAAAVVLVLGVADQSLTGAIPDYAGTARTFESDQSFVQSLQNRLPPGSPIFQIPFLAFPETRPLYDSIDNDQVRLSLHSTTLRWSGGGIKGRPQTDWPATVSQEAPGQMTRDLAIVGFAGIVVDRAGTADHGAALQASLVPYTGPPVLVSPDDRWAYLSLASARARVGATLTARQRAAFAATIVRAAG